MKVTYLENRGGYNWNPVSKPISNPSNLHVQVRGLLGTMFPTLSILEEVAINPSPFQTLYLDFYIPVLCYAIEVHGEQHYKFVPHYHGDRRNFMAARQRDRIKKDWCILNNLIYIELPFNQQDQWENLINGQ